MAEGLLDLVKRGDLGGFESRCVDLLAAGDLPAAELAACFRYMEESGSAARVGPLVQMVFENSDPQRDPRGSLAIACAVVSADPENAALRGLAGELYERVYGQVPGFAAIMESSGLTTGAPARAALRVLDFCLSLNVGDTLISRVDGRVVEVGEVDRTRGLFTLRRAVRTTTIPARELVREYERIDAEDFRVLGQLHPERLPELLQSDPVALVVGLIRAHGGHIDADRLKHELVPRHIAAEEWSKWWTRARTLLKRSPHVLVEGRSPVVLSYSAAGITFEDETWSAIAAEKNPGKWLGIAQGYFREVRARKGEPDEALLRRLREHLTAYVAKIRSRRPGDALQAALVLSRLGGQGLPIDEPTRGLAGALLRQAPRPTELLGHVKEDELWELALVELRRSRPDDWVEVVASLVPGAPASQIDSLVDLLRGAGRLDTVQGCIDDALADPIDATELVYWLWRGPHDPTGLRLPADGDLFAAVLDTLAALGVSLHPNHEIVRHFKARMKAALSLHDYERAARYLQGASEAAALPLRRQLERLEGLGPVARSKLLDLLQTAHPELWVKREAPPPPWEDPDVLWVTQAGLDRKSAERDELVNVKMHENARRIGEAAAHGDLSENSEYKFALEERDFLRARLAQINRDLSIARVLAPHDVPINQVGIGSRVTLRSTVDGSQRVLTILGPFETDVDSGVYSYKAPVCQKLMGLRVGDRGHLSIEGQEHEFEVRVVESSLATSHSPPSGGNP